MASESTPILGSSRDENTSSKGKSLSDKIMYLIDSEEYFCFLPAEMIFQPADKHRVQMHNNRFFSIILLLLVMIGSSALTQPYAVSQMGIILSVFVYIFAGLTVYGGIYILIKAAERTGVYHFGNLAEAVLGESGKQVTEWSIIISLIFDAISSLILISDLLRGIVAYLAGDKTAWYVDSNFLIIVVTLLVILPICLVRRLGHLSYVALFSQLGMLAAVIGITIECAEEDNSLNDSNARLQYASFYGFLSCSGIVIWGITFAVGIFHVHRAMENPSAGELLTDCTITTVIGTIFLALFGIVGYLGFRNNTDPILIDNFDSVSAVVFRSFAALYYTLYTPSDFLIGRASFANALGTDVEDMPDMTYFFFAISTITVVTLVTILLNVLAPDNAISFVQNLAGGLAGGVWTFIIPGIIGRNIFSKDKPDASLPLFIVSTCIEIVGYVMICVVLAGTCIPSN